MNMNIPDPSGSLHQNNLDLFALLLRSIATGDLGQLTHAGLSAHDLAHLRNLKISQLMEMSDRGQNLSTYLKRANQQLHKTWLIAALIERRAPRELMVLLFGLSTRRYAAERARLGVAGGRGRPITTLSDSSIEHRIWRLWVVLSAPEIPARLRQPDHWLLIALEVPGHLRTAWSLIQGWARDEDALIALSGDHLRLGETACQQAELELRERHRVAMTASLVRHCNPRQTADSPSESFLSFASERRDSSLATASG